MSFPLSLDKVQHIPSKASVSYLFNNLSFNGTHFAYVHQNEIHVTLDTTTTKKGTATSKIVSKENSQITQTKWVNSNKGGGSTKNCLVITTQSHFQIYDQDCSKALFTYTLQPANFDATPGKTKYYRGIASLLHQNKTHLLIGTSKGNILVFEFQQGKSKEFCTVSQTLNAHSFPVCDIACDASSSTWASSDTNGNVILWNGLETKATFPGSGFPCASLAINKQVLICAYGNGSITVYDTEKGTKLSEIAAHSRFIQAIDLHPSLSVFATVSDDSILHLWELAPSTHEPSLLKSTTVKDSLLCGVAFCGESWGNVGVVAYDAAQIAVFTR